MTNRQQETLNKIRGLDNDKAISCHRIEKMLSLNDGMIRLDMVCIESNGYGLLRIHYTMIMNKQGLLKPPRG